jgi:hypothetical protein
LGGDGTQKFVDNLLINANGRICLVECKLWRNPEAVREVVAQILDYAGELAQLSYEALADAVRKARQHHKGDPIIETILGTSSLQEDQATLIDGISRSLKRGDFLLLVVGDGIRSGLQQIAGLLQNRATLGFSFGLVEMAIYGGKDHQGPYYVQPRLLLQTEIVTRTVFVVGETAQTKVQDVTPAGRPQSISEQEFYSSLAAVDPKLPDQVREFLDQCRALGCDPELKQGLGIYVDDPTGSRLNIGGIRKNGRVEIWGAARLDLQVGEPIGRGYLDRVAAFLGNATVKDDLSSPGDWHVRYEGNSLIPLEVMLNHSKEWLAAIQELIERFQGIEHQEGIHS